MILGAKNRQRPVADSVRDPNLQAAVRTGDTALTAAEKSLESNTLQRLSGARGSDGTWLMVVGVEAAKHHPIAAMVTGGLLLATRGLVELAAFIERRTKGDLVAGGPNAAKMAPIIASYDHGTDLEKAVLAAFADETQTKYNLLHVPHLDDLLEEIVDKAKSLPEDVREKGRAIATLIAAAHDPGPVTVSLAMRAIGQADGCAMDHGMKPLPLETSRELLPVVRRIAAKLREEDDQKTRKNEKDSLSKSVHATVKENLATVENAIRALEANGDKIEWA